MCTSWSCCSSCRMSYPQNVLQLLTKSWQKTASRSSLPLRNSHKAQQLAVRAQTGVCNKPNQRPEPVGSASPGRESGRPLGILRGHHFREQYSRKGCYHSHSYAFSASRTNHLQGDYDSGLGLRGHQAGGVRIYHH